MVSDAILYPSMVNRSQKREFEKMASKAFSRLSAINSSFVAYVVNEINDLEYYKFVYAKHFDWWKSECNLIRHSYPKLTINENWFAQNYNYEVSRLTIIENWIAQNWNKL
jgi:hypothetical protein